MGNCGSGEQTKKPQPVLANASAPDAETTKTQKPAEETTAASSDSNSKTTTTNANEPTAETVVTPEKKKEAVVAENSSPLPAPQDSISRVPEQPAEAKPSAVSVEQQKKADEAAVAAKKKADEEAAAAQKKKEGEEAAAAQKKKEEEEKAAAAKKIADEEAAAKKKAEEEEAKKKAEEEEAIAKKKKAEEEEKYKKEKLEAAILAYQNDIATAQVYRPEGPADLRDRSIHRACMNNPSIVQIKDLFGAKDTFKFKEMMYKMRIKKGLIGRQGFHPVLGMIVGNFFFYFPPAANDPKSPSAEAVQCLGSMYLKGVKVSEMDSVDQKRRILLEAAVPRKKGDAKKPGSEENSLQLGFDDELQRSKFEQYVEEVAVPQPSIEVAAAMKKSGKNFFIGQVSNSEVKVAEGDDE